MTARKDSREKHGNKPTSMPVNSPPARASGAGAETRDARHAHATRASGHESARWNALAGLALATLVVVSYLPAMLWGGFVWDDVLITEGEPVRSASGLWQIWFSPGDLGQEGHYWPLVYSTFWLEHKLWGFAPTGYHVVNVLLHLANTLLLWHLMRRLTVPGAWMIAAVFAVHPLHVESVAWVIERKDVLSGLLYLTAVLAWLRFVEEPRSERYALALVLFTMGMLAKSIVVTLPVALLIYHWWKQGQVNGRDVLRLVPFFAAGLVITLADLAFNRSKGVGGYDYSIVERALIAAQALWFYAGKLLWPADLAVIYPRWDVDAGDPLAWTYLVAAVATTAALWLFRSRIGRGPLAGSLFFAVTLSPVLGFVDYSYMQFSFVADRYQYLGGIGVLAVIIGAVARSVRRHAGDELAGTPSGVPLQTRPRSGGTSPDRWGFTVMVPVVTVIILTALGTLTWRQAGIYRDEITFFNYVISHNPQALRAHLNLGNALSKQGRLEDAAAAFRVDVAQNANNADALANLAGTLIKLNRLDEAEPHLRRALEIDPRHATATQNLAALFRKEERHEEALEQFAAVLEIDPDNAQVHVGMGRTLSDMQRYDEAAEHYQSALQITPRSREVLEALGVLHFERRHFAEALPLFQTMVEIDPDNATAHSNLGAALYYLDRSGEALASFDRALELEPSLESAETGRNNAQRRLHGGPVPDLLYEEALTRGKTLFAQGRQEDALTSILAALERRPDSVDANVSLGTILIEMGRHDEAEKRLRRARERHPQATDILQNLAEAIRQQGRYDEALEVYDAIIGVDPDHALAYAAKGNTLFLLQRYDEALNTLAQALALAPDQPLAPGLHVLMGRAAQATGEIDAAAEHYGHALDVAPHHADALARLAALRIGQQRYNEALTLLQTLRNLKPDSARTHTNVGIALSHLGRSNEALRSFERALAIDPTFQAARNNLDKLRKEEGIR